MIYKTINEFWRLPAIVKGIREKIWDNLGKYPYLDSLWVEEGLIDDGGLTLKGLSFVDCSDLLEYELSMVQDQVNHDKLKTIPRNYDRLRSGLGRYFNNELYSDWLDVIGKLGVDHGWCVLDYGGGSGNYIQAFKGEYPQTFCYLADRPTTKVICNTGITHIPVDFKKDPNWFLPYKERFNLIFVNEVLHLGEDIHDYLIESSLQMLKPDCFLVIGEQVPSPRFDWRMSAMTGSGACVSVEQIKSLAQKHGLGFVFTQYVSDSHYFVVLRK